MKQTQNYQLSQWDKTDRIEMEDFNADNSKVDAALTGLAGQVASKASQAELAATQKWVKISESTLSADGKEITVTVPSIQQYRYIQVCYTTSGSCTASFTWNGANVSQLHNYYTSSGKVTQAMGLIEAQPAPSGIFLKFDCYSIVSVNSTTARYSPLIYPDGSYSGDVTVGLKETVTSGNLAAGTHMEVYGMKL